MRRRNAVLWLRPYSILFDVNLTAQIISLQLNAEYAIYPVLPGLLVSGDRIVPHLPVLDDSLGSWPAAATREGVPDDAEKSST